MRFSKQEFSTIREIGAAGERKHSGNTENPKELKLCSAFEAVRMLGRIGAQTQDPAMAEQYTIRICVAAYSILRAGGQIELPEPTGHLITATL